MFLRQVLVGHCLLGAWVGVVRVLFVSLRVDGGQWNGWSVCLVLVLFPGLKFALQCYGYSVNQLMPVTAQKKTYSFSVTNACHDACL